jgi:hypothetical protein
MVTLNTGTDVYSTEDPGETAHTGNVIDFNSGLSYGYTYDEDHAAYMSSDHSDVAIYDTGYFDTIAAPSLYFGTQFIWDEEDQNPDNDLVFFEWLCVRVVDADDSEWTQWQLNNFDAGNEYVVNTQYIWRSVESPCNAEIVGSRSEDFLFER